MDTLRQTVLIACWAVGSVGWGLGRVQRAPAEQTVTLPENLAPRARITADFQHSRHYPAELVADGNVPQTLTRSDFGQVWITETDHKGGRNWRFSGPSRSA